MVKHSKYSVIIKWGKQKFENVEIDLEEDILTFKAQIYALTLVPVDKQKISFKGKLLKEGNTLNSYNLKEVTKSSDLREPL